MFKSSCENAAEEHMLIINVLPEEYFHFFYFKRITQTPFLICDLLLCYAVTKLYYVFYAI